MLRVQPLSRSSFTQPANELNVGKRSTSAGGGAATLSCYSLENANAGNYWRSAAFYRCLLLYFDRQYTNQHKLNGVEGLRSNG